MTRRNRGRCRKRCSWGSCDRECADWDRIGRRTVAEQNNNLSSVVRDHERAESKKNNTRQKYCGDRQLPDLEGSQLEQDSGNSRQGFHGHGDSSDCERAEPKNNDARQNYCGYNLLPDPVCSQLEQKSSKASCHGHGQLPDRESAKEIIKKIDRITMGMASCLTLSVPNWNRIAETLDSVVKVMASCLTLIVPSWNRMTVILDSVVIVMASCLTVSVPRRKIITILIDRFTVGIACCPPRRFPVGTDNSSNACLLYTSPSPRD